MTSFSGTSRSLVPTLLLYDVSFSHSTQYLAWRFGVRHACVSALIVFLFEAVYNQPANNLFSAIKTNTIRTLQTTAEGYQRSHTAQ